jgi:hypothetical protein
MGPADASMAETTQDGALDVINALQEIRGDEAFLALATLRRNGRRHRLFPHDQQKE